MVHGNSGTKKFEEVSDLLLENMFPGYLENKQKMHQAKINYLNSMDGEVIRFKALTVPEQMKKRKRSSKNKKTITNLFW